MQLYTYMILRVKCFSNICCEKYWSSISLQLLSSNRQVFSNFTVIIIIIFGLDSHVASNCVLIFLPLNFWSWALSIVSHFWKMMTPPPCDLSCVFLLSYPPSNVPLPPLHPFRIVISQFGLKQYAITI